ncbi:Alpha-muurolene synthase [Mycena venus]|uniref:Alpha-muurolene synthase n=1 Tax=Mycena venus TaxID=2733690 RepID=A0A8H7CGW9_9AGAR|nr:Alpha-muurolene synthase [Mycena venus]
MSATTSVQLPDLLSLGREFELRTNRHSRTVTSASEKWFMTEENGLSATEKADLRSMKIGLWASACFPTCDPPQLRLAADFLTALVICNCRITQAQSLRECGWADEQPAGNLPCLAGNDLFRDFIQNVASAMPSREKFNRSAEAFRVAQTQVISHRKANTLPTLEAYADLRRDLSGIPMVFDLIEMAEGLKVPSGDAAWDGLKISAANLIALSTDIFAYNNDQFIGNQFNIVSIVRTHRGLSVQAAIKYAFSLIDQSFQKFLSAESTLFSQSPVPGQTTSMWTWNPLNWRQTSEKTPAHVQLTSDSKLYLCGLKDCIVGTLNWSYETGLYFGSKGDEIRAGVHAENKSRGWGKGPCLFDTDP